MPKKGEPGYLSPTQLRNRRKRKKSKNDKIDKIDKIETLTKELEHEDKQDNNIITNQLQHSNTQTTLKKKKPKRKVRLDICADTLIGKETHPYLTPKHRHNRTPIP